MNRTKSSVDWPLIKRIAAPFVAIFVALFVGMLVMLPLLSLSVSLYPMPADLDLQDQEQLAAYVATLPPAAFLLVLAAHQLGTLLGGAITSLVVKRFVPILAISVGLIFLIAGVANLNQIPHPLWFAVTDCLLYLPAALAGAWLTAWLVGWSSGEKKQEPADRSDDE